MTSSSSIIPETEILKPKDPTIIDNNDWPVFQLTQADVFDPATGQPCSLLLADEARGFTVVGRLEKRHDRRQYLHNRRLHDTLPLRISIANTQTYSYGQDDRGDIILWAAGSAGWFELSPSRTYKEVHASDCEAVICLYFVADLYRGLTSKKRWTLPVEEVFTAYAEEARHTCRSADQAEAVFKSHKEFLIDCMTKGKEGLKWKRTAIYDFLLDEGEAEEDAVMADGDEIPPPRTPTDTPTRDPRATHAGKGRSTLRPTSKKHKGPFRTTTGEEAEDLDSTMASTDDPSPMIPAKRKAGGGNDARGRRSLRSNLQDDDSDLPLLLPDDDGMGTAEEVPLPFKPLPANGRPKPRQKPPSVRFRTTSIPSFDATIAGDVWSCPFDGCNRRVYAASTLQSRQLIKEHFQEHAFDAQAQIDLVYAEERPYLPVGRLVEKIRAMAAQDQHAAGRSANVAGVGQSGPAVAGMQQLFPTPIVQKF